KKSASLSLELWAHTEIFLQVRDIPHHAVVGDTISPWFQKMVNSVSGAVKSADDTIEQTVPPGGIALQVSLCIEIQKSPNMAIREFAWRHTWNDIIVVHETKRTGLEVEIKIPGKFPVACPRLSEGVEAVDRPIFLVSQFRYC